MNWTIADVLARLQGQFSRRPERQLTSPEPEALQHSLAKSISFMVESMRRHTTDEGWQLAQSLEYAGYTLYGYGIGEGLTDVRTVVQRDRPGIVVIQDKREWEGLTADGSRDPRIRFQNVDFLRSQPHIFKTTILKDAHHDGGYNRAAAEEIGCHAWIVYYHPRIIKWLAPWVRERHLIRTHHTVDGKSVPGFSARRKGILLSGAISNAYPLRRMIASRLHEIPEAEMLRHPGYHRRGCETPAYLQTLSRFRVSICTASIYGYALRKIIESVACGCAVITDLPRDDPLPEIDDCLIRVRPDIPFKELKEMTRQVHDEYDPDFRESCAIRACKYYDYRPTGLRLASAIRSLRDGYRG